MPRISVSVNQEIFGRLETFKDKFNVSEVCREALERRIDALEAAAVLPTGELDLESLIARLRDERAFVEGRFEKSGGQNAVIWLSTASYQELKDVAENHNGTNFEKYKLPAAAFRMMKKDMEDANATCDGGHAVAYKTGWLDSVKTVWAQVVDQVEETSLAAAHEASE